MPGSGEGGIGIGATHEGIAYQHHIDVTHNGPQLCYGLLLWA